MNDQQKLAEAFRLFRESTDHTLRAAFLDAVIERQTGEQDIYLEVTAEDDKAEFERGMAFFKTITGEPYWISTG